MHNGTHDQPNELSEKIEKVPPQTERRRSRRRNVHMTKCQEIKQNKKQTKKR
jgi:hypothetical protein